MNQEHQIVKNSFRNFVIILGVACFALGNIFSNFLVNSKTNKEVERFKLAYQYIMNEWYFGVDDDNLSEDLINKAIQSLLDRNIDPHSHYQITSGSVDDSYSKGYGMSIVYYNHYTKIIKVQPNSPISKVRSTDNDDIKVEEGDYLVEVNGNSTYRKTTSEVTSYFKSNHIKGESDLFKIRKSNNQEYLFAIVADSYEVETSTGKIITPNTGLLTISSFEFNTPSKAKKILDNYQANNIENLIIDLRNNPGGFIDSVVEIVDWFLPKGTTIATFTKKDGSTDVIKSTNGIRYNFKDILVITNGGSASASELLSGTLVDNGIGKTVGSTTYGKGSAQKTIRLGIDGGQLSYTYALWTTSPNRVIHGVGISPNYPYDPSQISYYNVPNIPNFVDNYFVDDKSDQIETINTILDYLGYDIELSNILTSKNMEAYLKFKEDYNLGMVARYDYNMYMKLNDIKYDRYIAGQDSIVDFAVSKAGS